MYTPERDRKEPNILKKEQKESNCINIWHFITLPRGTIIIRSLGKIDEKQIQKCYAFLLGKLDSFCITKKGVLEWTSC